jgi:hypothetical protein
MSRKFAKVFPNIWKSQKMRDVSPNAKLLGMYFLTSPFYCMVGIYEQLKEVACKHTGLTTEELKELREIDFVRYDEETEVVWVVDMSVSQVSDGQLSPKQRQGIINELTRLHIESQFPFVAEFIDHYKATYPFLPDSPDKLDWEDIPFA